ncbi:MAG TPA: hypothetical protein VKA46_11490 [Gemmataceae bacterium]|nr:hypothetical protein [Gemmataceae bacterium]
MTQSEFDTIQEKFAQRLLRLIQLPNRVKGRTLDVDAVAHAIETVTDGTEDTTGIIVTQIPSNDRRLRECMVAQGHVLADVPSQGLFGEPFASDVQRVSRYELVAALMVASGFPAELLDDGSRFERWRFPPTSNFFKIRKVVQLNEQFISCWARRLLCFFGEITNVRVVNCELRDNLARGNRGMTTEDLLEQELGPDGLTGNGRTINVGRQKVQLPLVRSKRPGSLPLTAERVAEILEDDDVSS